MKKSIRKILAIILLVSMFFSFQQISTYAAQDVKPKTASKFIIKCRELIGYYNIEDVKDLKEAASANDSHAYTLKNDLVVEEPITITGYLKLEGNNKTIKSSKYDGKKGCLIQVSEKGYLDLYNTIMTTNCPTISNYNYLYLCNVKATSNKSITVQNRDVLTISGGTFTSKAANMVTLGINPVGSGNTTTTINNNAKFYSNNFVEIYLELNSTLNFNSGYANKVHIAPNRNNKISHKGGTINYLYSIAFNFLCPLESPRVSSEWSLNRTLNGKTSPHSGIDLAAATGTAIFASESGTVVHVKYDEDGYGKYLTIKHEKAGKILYTRYAHCSKIIVKAGQTVSRGTKIAEVGRTGYSTGPHLHFEIRTANDYNNINHTYNPRQYIIDGKPMYFLTGVVVIK